MNFNSSSAPRPEGDGDRLRSVWAPAAPAHIGEYRVLGLLGSGGMGTVWDAVGPRGQRLAIKLMKDGPWRTSTNALARFLQEADAARRIVHPNVVRVDETGVCELGVYIAMEKIEGRTLAALLPTIRDLDTRMQILLQVARGVAAVHRWKIVHRDVKPQNVMVDAHGRAKVTDFSIAWMANETRLTGTSTVLGTPGYMAPEQLRKRHVPALRPASHAAVPRSKARQPGTWSDVYSLGVMLYEMVAMSHPFPGGIDAVLSDRVEPAPVRTRWQPSMVNALRRVWMRALAKNPDVRYPHAASFAEGLEQAIEEGRSPLPERVRVRYQSRPR